MPGFENTKPEPSIEEVQPAAEPQPGGVLNALEPASPEKDVDKSSLESPMRWGNLSSQMDRFSSLSSDMITLISELSREAKAAMDQLHEVRAEVKIKKSELETLHDMEESAEELHRLIKDRRLQVADLERHLESLRSAFETEKTRREQEDKRYQENMDSQRQREEAEYREKRAAEQLRAKQMLEDELRALRQESIEKQEALNNDLLEREQRIMQKEKELDLLTQELEQFISRLAGRTQLIVPVQEEPSDSSRSMIRDV